MQFQVDHSANFYCVIKSIESLLLTLKSVHITDNVSCYISGEGIILTVEHSRSVKAVAYILRGSFNTFRIRDDVVMPTFGLSINSLIDSITAVMPLSFGPYESKPVENIIKLGDESDYCEMTYDGAGSLLGLRRSIKETNQFVQCTMVPFEREEESEELKFDETQDPVQLIVIPAKWFKDALEDLEDTTEIVQMSLSPEDVAFQLTGQGASGMQNSEIPKGSDLITKFSCRHRVSVTYIYSHLIMCKKSLALSYEVSVEIHQSGALRLIIKLMDPVSADNFVEFSFLPSTRFV